MASVLAIGCGGRTMLDGVGALGGGDGGVDMDAPATRDAPITRFDGPGVGEDGPIGVTDGGFRFDVGLPVDVSVPFDISVPPPPPPPPPPKDGGGRPKDGGVPPEDVIIPPFDGPVIVDGGKVPDGSLPDVIVFDAGSEGGLPVFCGGESCSSGEQCCVGFSGGTPTASCVTSGDCDGGLALSCTGSDNCGGGEVCCGSFGGGSAGASCEPSCGPGSVQLCTDDGICPPGEKCFTTPIGLAFCRP